MRGLAQGVPQYSLNKKGSQVPTFQLPVRSEVEGVVVMQQLDAIEGFGLRKLLRWSWLCMVDGSRVEDFRCARRIFLIGGGG